MGRLYGFIASILIGLALGLAFGWLVAPPRVSLSRMPDLRADYRLDYVLMVAEAYADNPDPALAAQRLALLESRTPLDLAAEAYQLATQAGYAPQDLMRLEDLIRGVHISVVPAPTPTPEALP